jgi:D-ribose pyranose/furanose isomerase RbsD
LFQPNQLEIDEIKSSIANLKKNALKIINNECEDFDSVVCLIKSEFLEDKNEEQWDALQRVIRTVETKTKLLITQTELLIELLKTQNNAARSGYFICFHTIILCSLIFLLYLISSLPPSPTINIY